MRNTQAGLGIVQMVIAAGLMMMISVGTLALMTDLFKGVFSAQKSANRTDLVKSIHVALSNKDTCKRVLNDGSVVIPANWTSGENQAIPISTIKIDTQTVAELGKTIDGLQTQDLRIEMVSGPYPVQFNLAPEGVDPILRRYRRYFARLTMKMIKTGGELTNTGGVALKENNLYLSLVASDTNQLYDCTGGIDEVLLQEICEKSFDGSFSVGRQPWCALFNLGIGIHKSSLPAQYPRFSVLEKRNETTLDQDLTMVLYGDSSAASNGPGLWFVSRPTTPVAATGNLASIAWANRNNAHTNLSKPHDFILSNRSNNGDLEVGSRNVAMKVRQVTRDIHFNNGLHIEASSLPSGAPPFSVYSTNSQGRMIIGGRSDNGQSYSVFYLSSNEAGNPVNIRTDSWALAHKAPSSGQPRAFQISRWTNGTHSIATSITPGTHNFGVGVVNPSAKLEVAGNLFIHGNLRVNGNMVVGGTVTSASDRNLKKNIHSLKDPLAQVLQLQPVSFRWKEDVSQGQKQIGFIAQEVKKVAPEVVISEKERFGVAYDQLGAVLVGGLQEMARFVFQSLADSNKTQQQIEKLERQWLEVVRKEEELEAENRLLESQAQICLKKTPHWPH